MRRGTVRAIVAFLALATAVLCGAGSAVLGLCGPFTDVAADVFCPFVLEIFYLGITTGTTATTYDPASNVTRLQMAAFLSRTVDGVLKRASARAALDQFWTSQNATVLGLTTVGTTPADVKSDGADLWVANFGGNTVSRVRGSDGKLLETWTGATAANGVAVSMGRILVTGQTSPGSLYQIDPTQAAGAVTTVASNLGNLAFYMAFDGARLWTSNVGSVSIVTPSASVPWTVTTVTTGFTRPYGMAFDGTNIWTSDRDAGTVLKLDATGAILQTVTVGSLPQPILFDGTNLWVPNLNSNSITVIRVSSGAVLATLTGNGLSGPNTVAFDGQRALITNNSGASVSLWKAADLTSLGTSSLPGSSPNGSCSDGLDFWVTIGTTNQLARF